MTDNEKLLVDALKKYDQITRVVIMALDRDYNEGKLIRGEMRDELKDALNNTYNILEKIS